MNPVPIHILGGGSIGLLLAGRLAAVRAVTLIRRPGTKCDPRARIRLWSGEKATDISIAQRPADGIKDPIRQLIVCTKAYDAETALAAVADRLPGDAMVLLMQNGMSSQERIAEAYPELRTHAGTSTEGAYRLGATEVVHAGRGVTRIGPLRGDAYPWHETFRSAGFEAEAVDSIRSHLADKLRVNALINPLTVLYECRNGELLENPEARTLMQRLGAEADAALGAAGYRFQESAFRRAKTVADTTAANVSSMLQDARAGKTLELEPITGYLVALGERYGVDVGTHRNLLNRLSSG